MNENLTLEGLSRLIMSKHNITKEEADTLLKIFLNVIEDGLKTDRYVRIKGLGTFKLIEDNISNRTLYNKIIFVPEAALKESINKPFAHFEPVVLNDNVQFDDIEECYLSDHLMTDNESEEDESDSDNSNRTNLETSSLEKLSPAQDQSENSNNYNIENDPDVEDIKGYYKPDSKVDISRKAGFPWYILISVLVVGIVSGSIVSWMIIEKKIDTQTYNTIATETVDTNFEVTDNRLIKDTINNEDTVIVAEKMNVGHKSENEPVSAAENKINDKDDKDIVYSEKLTYKISGTIDSHIIVKGNTLAKISYKYYRNKKMWPYIVMHNKDIIKDPNNVPIGTKINIPKLEIAE